MADFGRKKGEAALVAALAGGKTVRAAAEEAGVGETTVYRRLRDERFRRAVDEARAAMVGRITGELIAASTAAVATLRALLDADADTVRLGAARAVLELAGRVRGDGDHEERLRRLEEAAEQLAPVAPLARRAS
jgi:transposase-like protein